MNEIKIVLVGRTGHGKSSTGNTILRDKKSLIESSGAECGTPLLEVRIDKWVDYNNVQVAIFDSPGDFTLVEKQKERKKFIQGEMDRLMFVAKEIHVFVLVFSFTARYTQEEKETVDFLKEMFGNNVLKNHGMLVITHGDNCDTEALRNNKTTEETFTQWNVKAGKDFQDLLLEVGTHLLLVNNTGDFSDTSARLKSSEELREMIMHVSKDRTNCTKADYDKLKKKCCIL